MANTKSWSCRKCGAQNNAEQLYCLLCLVACPMDRTGIPQIFSGLVIHFNGIIPRTLKHPSHSIEWRMAERHGATCAEDFDPARVTTLIYRQGYERSDKVKLALEQYKIIAVTIEWMLDSLLQSRYILPTLYRLKEIPPVALPTVKGSVLAHHQHPFYMLNMEEYSLFPLSKDTNDAATRLREGATGRELDKPPKPVEIAPFIWERVGIFHAAASAVTDASCEKDEEAKDTLSRGIDFLKKAKNRLNPTLFAGMSFVLSETLEADENVKEVLTRFGGKVIKMDGPGVLEAAGRGDITHVLYDHGDKKGKFMVAASAAMDQVPDLQFCEALWAEDCLLLDEIVPTVGQYVPTAKLMNTLAKKRIKG